MASTSFLLPTSANVVDTELDALFKSASIKPGLKSSKGVTDIQVPTTDGDDAKKSKKQKKRKAEAAEPSENPSAIAGPSSTKKLKTKAATYPDAPATASPSTPSVRSPKKDAKKSKAKTEKLASEPKKSKASKKKSAPALDSSEDEDEDNSDLENLYLSGKHKRDPKNKAGKEQEDAMDVDPVDAAEESEDDDDSAPTNIVHESLQPAISTPKSRSGKQKFVPSEETPERRDQRTIFVGNIPIAVAQKRPLQKQLQKHILALVPTSKIESVRFRSVPFQNPTSKLPTSDDEGENLSKPKSQPNPAPRSTERPTNHQTERANSWRTKLDEKDENFVKRDVKSFLTPGQKKKIAFIHHEFHGEADSVNAYIVFAHPVPAGTRPANLPPLPETMDPYEAAKMAVEKCNNTLFMERILRVDRVGKAGGRKTVDEGDGEQQEDGSAAPLLDADPKYTIFVGALDFASKEEDLRAFFENLLVSEKGPAPTTEDAEADDGGVKKPASWVVRVRIVRDKETQLGKGFAYVQFSDKECVDEILALEEVKLKFAKRKLRVQRCKTLPGSKVKVKPTVKGKDNKPKQRGPPVVVPKGDPTLGERIAHLPKIVRKQAKAADGDRIARRLAKKKARMAMGPPKEDKDGRERTRKSGAAAKKGAVNTGKKAGKPRVRNEKNAAARNAKK